MSLRDSWRRFKEMQPRGTYSYGWWETLISFALVIAIPFTLILGAYLNNVLIIVIAISLIFLDFYWSRREIKGREKYREVRV